MGEEDNPLWSTVSKLMANSCKLGDEPARRQPQQPKGSRWGPGGGPLGAGGVLDLDLSGITQVTFYFPNTLKLYIYVLCSGMFIVFHNFFKHNFKNSLPETFPV